MKKLILFFFAALVLPFAGFSQGTTTGSIEGTVTDINGEPLPGATIIAQHMPTGTEYGTASRPDGRYTLRSVRIGGPYEVRITFVGFNPQIVEIDRIELGERYTLDFTLEEGAQDLGEISVVAAGDRLFNPDRTGARTNITSEDISRTPSVFRSLGDFTRLTPQVTSGNSFGGANDRYNNILVDGATLNDVFGLGDATPGSQAGVSSPLSIDAIAEFNVDIAPFEVTNNGFTGGQVNAVTKSGTNNYEGSVYFQTRNENLIGDYDYFAARPNIGEDIFEKVEGGDFPSFTERYIGLNIGGPIIQDKLFFFINAEFKRETSPITTGVFGSGAPVQVGFEPATFDQISSILQNEYGYDPGAYTSPLDTDTNNDKVLAKLDWNINQDNKLSFRMNYVDALADRGISRGQNSYTFSNRQYNFNSKQTSFVSELTSRFSDNAYNEARLVYTRIRDSRDVPSQRFPSVTVSMGFDDPDRNGFGAINAGVERFSQANALDQDLIEFTNNFTYIRGDHEMTFGTSNQIFTFDNLFVQDAFGTYTFWSIDDLEAGDPVEYQHSYLLPDGNPTANFTGMQFGLYAQDKWSATDYLKLTYGLRIDIPVLPDEPSFNPDVPDAFPGYSTDKIVSGQVLWAPRLGFNWDASQGERTTQIRGGVGIFSGTPPFVWISNQYSNTGVDYGRVDEFNFGRFDGLFSPDPDNQPTPGTSPILDPVETSEINLLADDFKYPQALKVNLAVDQELPYGIRGTLEGIYSKGINDVVFENINLESQGESAYGRPIYGEIEYNSRFGNASGDPVRVDPRFTNAIVMSNSDEGYQYSLTGELEKSFDFGLYTKFSYTYNRAENVNNGTSSRAISNWQYNENVDVNSPEVGTADFERRHRILGIASYRIDYSERFATSFSFIYDGRSGTPFSWIYTGDANGDGRFDNDLIYVPANESEVVLTSDNWSEFEAWINSEESISDYRGGFVDRNTAREPWTNFVDFKVTQEIKTVSGQSLELSASVINFLNLLNSEWGVRRGVSYNNYRAYNFEQYVDQDYIDNRGSGRGLTASDIGKPVISFDPNDITEDRKFSIRDQSSRWQMQFTVRYNF
ncbi:carboxypeptidase regulatory-like domain-containing protein [Gracilimonas sp. Q87]|uniref:TonB-dependent receptor n=1 Tax=Gracilimonas sp. Q87 TaxID=3384766 RepID=UPI0039841ADC